MSVHRTLSVSFLCVSDAIARSVAQSIRVFVIKDLFSLWAQVKLAIVTVCWRTTSETLNHSHTPDQLDFQGHPTLTPSLHRSGRTLPPTSGSLM